jgi:hypothetical protein
LQNLKINAAKFLYSIVDFYYNNFERGTSDSLFIIKKMIMALPKLPVLFKILKMKLFSKKEILTIKVILDIYEHYFKTYDLPGYNIYQQEYIPVAYFFYSNLSKEDINQLSNSFKSNKNKELQDILVLRMNSVIKKKKSDYLKYLEKAKINFTLLSQGMDLSKFYI